LANALPSVAVPTPSPADPRKSDLRPAAQRLVELIQFVHFGRIEGFVVRDGEPCFDPAPRVIRTLKLGSAGRNFPGLQTGSEDFALKKEVIELLDQLRQIGDGVIAKIEIAHGLPVLLELEEDDGGGGQHGRTF
jgi:hypothetical protein